MTLNDESKLAAWKDLCRSAENFTEQYGDNVVLVCSQCNSSQDQHVVLVEGSQTLKHVLLQQLPNVEKLVNSSVNSSRSLTNSSVINDQDRNRMLPCHVTNSKSAETAVSLDKQLSVGVQYVNKGNKATGGKCCHISCDHNCEESSLTNASVINDKNRTLSSHIANSKSEETAERLDKPLSIGKNVIQASGGESNVFGDQSCEEECVEFASDTSDTCCPLNHTVGNSNENTIQIGLPPSSNSIIPKNDVSDNRQPFVSEQIHEGNDCLTSGNEKCDDVTGIDNCSPVNEMDDDDIIDNMLWLPTLRRCHLVVDSWPNIYSPMNGNETACDAGASEEDFRASSDTTAKDSKHGCWKTARTNPETKSNVFPSNFNPNRIVNPKIENRGTKAADILLMEALMSKILPQSDSFRKSFTCEYCSEEFHVLHRYKLHVNFHNVIENGNMGKPHTDQRLVSPFFSKFRKRMPQSFLKRNVSTGKVIESSRQVLLKRMKQKSHLKFMCKFCDLRFSTKVEYQNHVQVHLSAGQESDLIMSHESPARSDSSQTFASNVAVIEDVDIGEGNASSQALASCILCGETFKVLHSLIIHNTLVHSLMARLKQKRCIGQKKKRTRPGRFPCHICSKVFDRSFVLKTHMLQHTGERNIYCETCGRGFLRKHDLVIHMRRHTGERPFACAYCTNTFTSRRVMNVHMRRHTGTSSPILCPVCGKVFTRTSHVTRHMRCHTKEKPFQCKNCGGKFSDRRCLTRHESNRTCFNRIKELNDKGVETLVD